MAQVNEGRAWLGLGLESKFHKDWLYQLELQSRWGNDFSRWEQVFIQGGLTREFGKRLTWDLEYRYSYINDDQLHRISTGPKYQLIKAKPWYLTLRGRFQQDWLLFDEERYWRTKANLRHRFNKRYSGYLTSELWLDLLPSEDDVAERIRTGAGVQRKIDDHSIKLIYYYQWSLRELDTSHILSLSYSFDWNVRKKKKKEGDSD
jgi:hypothetical protein